MISSKMDKKNYRLVSTIIAVLLVALACFVNPINIGNIIAKIALATAAVVIAYYADKRLFPQVDFEDLSKIMKYGQDERNKDRAVELAKATMLRRAIVTASIVLGICLGL